MLLAFAANAQSNYAIPWFKVASGGATAPGTGGVYTLKGTLGQPDAGGPVTSGPYGMAGGFWGFGAAIGTPGSPALAIQNSNNVLTILWPTSASSYCLETTFDLSPPVIWQGVTSGITTNGSLFVFTLATSPSVPKQFFRLAFPCSSAPAAVSLSFQISNNVASLSWPGSAFRLETTFSFSPPVTWQSISNGITTEGELRAFTFTNNPAVTNQFFRLVYP